MIVIRCIRFALVAATLVFSSAGALADNGQLYVFSSSWCEPCRAMEPVVERLIHDGYPVQQIDIDKNAEAASRFGVSAVPSFILVKNGKIAHRVDQATTLDYLQRMLNHFEVSPQSTVRGQSPASRLSQLSSAVVGAISPDAREDGSSVPQEVAPSEPRGQRPLRQPDNTQRPEAVPLARANSDTPAAVAATVRISIEDVSGHSYGSGTLIDVHGNDALILTCAHILRDSQEKGQIKVDRFDGPRTESMMGTLIGHDYELDVAIIGIKLTRPMVPASLANPDTRLVKGDNVFSVGCNHGEMPTVINGAVNAVNQYLGPANITASGRPVDGRSGGGLFDGHGRLIGVCNAADPKLDEGLYAALPRIQNILDKNGLAFVYERERPIAEVASLPNTPLPSAVADSRPVPLSNTDRPSTSRLNSAIRVPTTPTPTPPTPQPNGEELVCVVRSPSDNGQSRVIIVPNPSPALIRQLTLEANGQR